MSFYKTGIVYTSNINESLIESLSPPFDNTIYTEPDNSRWIRIFHHNNPAENLFSSADPFSTGVYKNEDMWFNVSVCNFASTWELMIIQARLSTDTPEKFRWIQLVNPMVANYSDVALANITRVTTSGYTTASGNYAGLYLRSNQTTSPQDYLTCNNGTASNWFGAIGSWTAHQGGIPAYNGSAITTGYTNLYLRLSNDLEKYFKIDKASIYNEAITLNTFIER